MHKKEKLFKIGCLSIAEFIVAFPISDNIHFLIGSVPAMIGIIYLLNKMIYKIELKEDYKLFLKFFFEYLSDFIIIGSIFYFMFLWNEYIQTEKYYSSLEHFKNIEISEDFEDTIKIIDNYIQTNNKDVYILNFDAAIYMIPINRYNKNYDMFNKGNFGSKGEEGQIEAIKNTDAKFLIVKDGINRNWQNPEKVRRYIQDNMIKTDTIKDFDVYENRR